MSIRSLARFGSSSPRHNALWFLNRSDVLGSQPLLPRVHERAFAVAARRSSNLLKAQYQAMLSEATVRPDARQAALVDDLSTLVKQLAASVHKSGGKTWTKGAYVFGPVGSGKSMIVGMAFEAASKVLGRLSRCLTQASQI